jgi:hypothetical protein
MPDGIVLSEQDRLKLDGIVKKMIANKESEANINFVVNDFKNKYGLKKKESSGSTSQKGAGVSPTKTTTTSTSSDTKPLTRAQAAVALGGPTKLFGQEEEKSLVSIMYGNEPKKEEFVPPSIPIDTEQSIKYLEKKTKLKIGQKFNVEEHERNRKELERLKALQKNTPIKERVEDIYTYQFNSIRDLNNYTSKAKEELDSEINNTGFLNVIKSGLSSTYNAVVSGLGKLADITPQEISDIQIETNPIGKEITEVKSDPKNYKLTKEEINFKAYQLAIENKAKSLRNSQTDDYLESIPEDVKNNLKFNKVDELKTIEDNTKKIVKVRDFYIASLENDYIRLNQLQQTNQDQNEIANVENRIKSNTEYIKKLDKSIYGLDRKHGSAEDEVDLLKRNYDMLYNISGRVTQTTLNALVTTADMIADFALIGTPRNSEYINKLKKSKDELVTETVNDVSGLSDTFRKDIKDVNNVNDFINWSSDVFSVQVPNLVAASTGNPGLLVMGATSMAQKRFDMKQEVLNGTAKYDDLQMVSIPLLWGAAEVVSEIPTVGILKKAGLSISAINADDVLKRELMNSTFNNFLRTGKDYAAGQFKENAGELFTNVSQNALNKYLLGKKEVGIFDNSEDILKDTFLMTSMLQTSPHIIGAVIKPFTSPEYTNVLDNNSRQILNLNKLLGDKNVSEEVKSVAKNKIASLNAESGAIVNKVISSIDKMPDAGKSRIAKIEKEQSQLRAKASEIAEDKTIDVNTKKELLNDLKSQFKLIEDERLNILSGKTTAEDMSVKAPETIDNLPLEEQDRLKRDALTQLTNELNPEGKEDIVISNEQITKRASEIQSKELIKPTEVKPAEVAPTEVKTEVVKPAEVAPTEVKAEKAKSVELKEPTIVVHGTVNGYGLQYSEGVSKENIVTPKDPRGFLPNEQQVELNKGNSVVTNNEGNKRGDGAKDISIVSPMTDAFGRGGAAVYDFVIPKNNESNLKGIQEIIDNVNKTDLKGNKLINETVRQVKEYIDSNKTTEAKAEEVTPAEVTPTENIDLEQITKNSYVDKISNNVIEKVGNNWVVKTEVEGKELFKSKTLKGAKEFVSNDNQEALRVKPTEVKPAEVTPEATAIEEIAPSEIETTLDEVITPASKDIKEQVSRAKKAISKFLPNVEIVYHTTAESFQSMVGDNSRGYYDTETKKIHINGSNATNNTVAHEVFHAVVLKYITSDKQATALTNRMFKALTKSIKNNPKLLEDINKFANNYSKELQSEEKLAEVVGYLASEYETLPDVSKNIIQKWIENIAKMVGIKKFTDQEVVDFMNTIATRVSTGQEITETDVKAIIQGSSTYIAEPTEINRYQKVKEEKVKVGDHKLSFVKESDLIDMDSLMKEISDKKEKVWFWVADQLGRGDYYDSVIDGEHYLDAGPSFALDPENRSKNIIWATGKAEKEITKLIGNSDYIFIISGSPLKSKLFNKSVVDIISKRAGDFNSFKKNILNASKIKPLNDVLSSVNSWEELRDTPKRKEFLLNILNQADKNTPLKKELEKYNSIIDLNELRDGFYADNNFELNDIMLVLKPTEFGGKSNHSTYENNILGEVIGVPDIKVNAFDILPSEIKDKYKGELGKSQQQQAVAPYGIGVKLIERKQLPNDYKAISKEILTDKELNTVRASLRASMPNSFALEVLDAVSKKETLGYDSDLDFAIEEMIENGASINNIANILMQDEDLVEKKNIINKKSAIDYLLNVGLKGTVIKAGQRAVGRKQISPENSSNYANMTEDGKGNFVFYHFGPRGIKAIDPKRYGSNKGAITSKPEVAAMGRVGGMSQFYTMPEFQESNVSGDKYMIKVPMDKVYDFNTDPENFYDRAREMFKAKHPDLPFTANDQLAYITKLAEKAGYDMTVAEWNDMSRAQSTKALKPMDTQVMDGNTISKPFNENYESNATKGFEPVIPTSKEAKLKDVYQKINAERNAKNRYDSLYSLAEDFPKLSQDKITDMIENSDISKEMKDAYAEALAYEPGARMSGRKQKSPIDTAVETANRKGFNDKEIADYLVGKGYTRAQATNAILRYNEVTAAKLRKEDSVFTKEGRNKIVTFLDQVKRRALSARSFLPKSVFLSKDKIESNIKAEAKRASYLVNDFNKLVKGYKGDVNALNDEFDKYLRGDQTAVLPDEFKAVAGKMRMHIDNLSQMLLRTGAVSVSQAETIAANLGQYINRSYQVFDKKNWAKQVKEEMREAARVDLRNMYRAEAESKAKQTGMDADIILEDFINKKIEELISGESAATFLGISKTGAKNLGIMKERLDIPLSIRQLMGEYTDASQNYARTVLKITTLAENARFLQSARESGMGVFFFNENDTNRPKEFNTKIAGDKSDTMSPLNGLYTTPEIAKAFAQKIGTGDAIEAALGTELGPVVRGIYETYMKALSSVKWLKTIGSVATHAKNVTGNLWFMLANGYYNPKKYAEAFSVLKNSSNEQLRDKLDEYIRAGIIDQSAALGEIRAMFADADFETAIENRLKKNPFQKVKAGVKKVGQKMTTAYQLEDDFFKIISYESEKQRYSNASFDKPFDQLTAEEQNIVKEKASEITKNILPNYARIPGLVKLLKAVPVAGTFVSFQAEAYRTAWNTVALAANELKSSNNKVKAIGAKRLAGIASSQAAKLGLMALMGTVISGGDDDDEDDKLKKNAKLFVAPWSKDSDLVLVDYGNGKMSYIDFSASDPHGGIKKAYNAAMSGKSVTESFVNGLTQLLEPFMTEDILLNTITDIKNNENSYGGKLYNESDTDVNKINAIMGRVYKSFEPGSITTVRKVVGSDDVRNELAGQLTGYKISTVDVEKQLSFKMKDLKDKADEAKRLYNSAFYKFEDGKITEKELNAAYNQANKSQKETYEKMIEYMKSASFFGIEDSVINDSMEGIGKGVVNDLWYGDIPDMKQKEKKLTDEEFRAKYGERLFEKLLRARELSKKGAR